MQRLVSARPEFDEDVLRRLPLQDLRALERGMQAGARELGHRQNGSSDAKA